jgi:hypothetical protein
VSTPRRPKGQIINARAFVDRVAVAYCRAGGGRGQGAATTSPDIAKVNCQRCLAIRQGVGVTA